MKHSGSVEAVIEVMGGIARAKDVPIHQHLDGGITEVTSNDLAEYVGETVERRLSRPCL